MAPTSMWRGPASSNQPVEYSIYPGVNHQVMPFAAMNEYVGWIAARFAGKPAPSNCASP
jgi:hypothetical protein